MVKVLYEFIFLNFNPFFSYTLMFLSSLICRSFIFVFIPFSSIIRWLVSFFPTGLFFFHLSILHRFLVSYLPS